IIVGTANRPELMAGPVYPREQAPADIVRGGAIDDRTSRRRGQCRQCTRIHGYVFGDRKWISAQRALHRIKILSKQLALTNEQELPRPRIDSCCSGIEQLPCFGSVELSHVDSADVRSAFHVIQEVPAVRQEHWKAVATLAGRDHARHSGRLPTVGGDAGDRPRRNRGKEDCRGRSPRPPPPLHTIGEWRRCGRIEVNPLELTVRKKGDGPAVGRPEWKPAIVGSGQRPRGKVVKRAQPQLRSPVRRGCKNELSSVRRYRERNRI